MEILTDLSSERGVSQGNLLQFYTDGDASFRALWQDIRQASQRVWLEVYIIEPDEVGQRTLDALTDASKRGCDVILIYDGLGSPNVGESFFRPLREAGGKVFAFNTVYPWQKVRQHILNPLHRDHRKIAILDDRVAYTGGANVSKDYAGPELGTDKFIDTMVRIEGPAARDMARIFLKSLQETSSLERRLFLPVQPNPEGVPVCVVGLNERQERESLDRLLRRAVDRAQDHCYIAAAYFVAPPWLRKSLSRAAQRGVDVRVVTAGHTDVPLARLAKRHAYGELLKSGARIYEMHDRMLHAKYLTIDERFSVIGSYNLDRWSDLHNMEVNTAAISPDLSSQLRKDFLDLQEQSVEYTIKNWEGRPPARRAMQWLVYALTQL